MDVLIDKMHETRGENYVPTPSFRNRQREIMTSHVLENFLHFSLHDAECPLEDSNLRPTD